MKPWFIVLFIGAGIGLIISYVIAHKDYPKLSSYVDTKTIHGVKPVWIITIANTYCKGSCTNSSSSSSSRGGSSFGGGK